MIGGCALNHGLEKVPVRGKGPCAKVWDVRVWWLCTVCDNGLKQAGREWYATLQEFLVNLGLCRTHADHSVFVFECGRSIIIIPVYVDDKLLAGNDNTLLNSV